jgi:hypothetical protein|tara:strand:- start:813 stop:1154 length:342 start_codon:yes stop_codon:yes gene_type:complete
LSRRKRYNAEQAKKPQQPPKIKHVVSKPRALLKSQKKHGVKKYEQQSKMAIPKEPLDQNVVEPTYKPNFVLKDKPGAETVVDRLLRRGWIQGAPEDTKKQEEEEKEEGTETTS